MEKVLDQYNQEVAEFFKHSTLKIEVTILKSRKEMNMLTGEETPDWMVAQAGDNQIYILDIDKFETESSHPKSDFEKILKHEISHVYYDKIRGNEYPHWLNEGIACHVADQNQNTPDKVTLEQLEKYYEEDDSEVYDLGKFVVEKIIAEKGKDKIFQMMKMDKAEINHELEKTFGFK